MTILRLCTISLLSLILFACGGVSFEEQIIADINKYIPSGICDKFPVGTKISNLEIGDITPIEGMGMIDVSYSFDYMEGDSMKHEESAMLYLDQGNYKKLASLGSDCDYDL